MKKLLLLLLAGLTTFGWLQAQALMGTCGMSPEDCSLLADRLRSNLKSMETSVSDRGAIQYVPIYFHLVGDDQGKGKIKESKVLDQLCALNERYDTMGIRFYLSPHPSQGTMFGYSINNNNVANNQTSWFTMQTYKNIKALNVYIVDTAASGGNSTEGVALAYYSINQDWVVANKAYINGNNRIVLAHEIGHFFSLLHTFNGWESNRFDSTDPTWPVAPSISPDGVPTEKMNGSNCSVGGDYLCDTPPDYNLGLGFNGCDYNLGAKDPTGALVDPMENDMMGYFLDCTPHVFTPQQQSAILADVNSGGRNFLDNTFSPVATSISTPTDLLNAPVNGQVTTYYDQVLLEWKPVTGATHYLVEVDFVADYISPTSLAFIVTSTSKLVTGLKSNRTYYWRVRPFNQYVTCATPRQSTFKTSTVSAIRDIQGLSAWQIAPNPVTNGVANLYVEADKSFEANIRVIDATGRQVFEQDGVQFATGETATELSLPGLQNGFYFVLLQNNAGQAVRKFTVLR